MGTHLALERAHDPLLDARDEQVNLLVALGHPARLLYACRCCSTGGGADGRGRGGEERDEGREGEVELQQPLLGLSNIQVSELSLLQLRGTHLGTPDETALATDLKREVDADVPKER